MAKALECMWGTGGEDAVDETNMTMVNKRTTNNNNNNQIEV